MGTFYYTCTGLQHLSKGMMNFPGIILAQLKKLSDLDKLNPNSRSAEMQVQGVIKCSRCISYLGEYKTLQLGDLQVLQGCATSLTVLQTDYIHSPQSLKPMYISEGIILLKVQKTV